jgi:hypothetical protein
MTEEERCRWHDNRLSLIEAALWGNPPERKGGMCKQMSAIEGTLQEIKIWTRAIVLIVTLYILVFGPDQIKEIIRLWK